MGRIRIGTWNVKGLGDTGGRQKGRRLKQWIHDRNLDIALVQETKLSEAKLAQLTDWWDGPQLWSPARGSKGGTAILVHRRIEAEFLDYDADLWGRWVWLKLRIEGIVLVVATVYAPNEPNDRLQFVRALPYCLPRTEHMVIGGDWNLVSSPGLDSEAVDSMRRDREAFLQWKEAWGLVDIFRVLHPREPGFTWFASTASAAGAKRRLDFLLTTGACTQNTQTVSESNAGMSDHKPVIMEMNWSQGNRRGPGHFRLNIANLEDAGWIDWTEKHWYTWQQTRAHFDSFEDWMDAGLRIISHKYEIFSGIAAYRSNKEERSMLKRIEEAEANMQGHPISELAWAEERTQRMGEWEQLQIEKHARWDMIQREKGIVASDRMSKQCFQKLLPKRNLTPMRELHHPHLLGMELAQSNEAMCEYAATYFKDILATRKSFWDWETDLTKGSSFWDTFTPRITEEGRRDMDRPVTAEELRETVKSMAAGKAPGDDGLPVEFYKACWKTLEKDLLQLYNGILTGQQLGKTMTKGIITLLYKKGDRSEVRNRRPISLLNVVYKILAKALARRLGRYLPALVGWDQGAFVQGRSIFDNILTAVEALEVIEEENTNVSVLMIDLEKAYDRVNWTFVMTTLRVIGFGEPFCGWVKALYAMCKLSDTTLKKIKAAARRFIWKPQADENQGYISKVAWETLCKPRDEGGLGITDPNSQNLALLSSWLLKVAEMPEPPDWCLLAEKILLQEWGLSRTSDVWVAIMMDSFVNKRIKSKFWSSMLSAWKKVKPDIFVEPKSKDEVKRQPLFDNPHIKSVDNRPFLATAAPGNFGMKWTQRGVSQIGDLWDDLTGQWYPHSHLRGKLRQLPQQEERLRALIAAIPNSWKMLLGPQGVNPTDTWFKSTAEEEGACFYRLSSWQDDESGKCELEEYRRATEHGDILALYQTISRWGSQGLEEIRVRAVRLQGRGEPSVYKLIAGGLAKRLLKIDPLEWGWQVGTESILDLSNLSGDLVSTKMTKGEDLKTKVINRWETAQPCIQQPSERELKRLWEQLAKIPSQRLASLLWLQSQLSVPTSKWLSNRGMEGRLECDRCSWPVEIMTHLWWACPRSQKWWTWWFRHWAKLSGTSYAQDERWVLLGTLPEGISSSKGWGYIAQVCRVALMWVIWMDRNGRRFQGQGLQEKQAERMFRTTLKLEIRADWRRKVLKGSYESGRLWFAETWARPGGLATITDRKLKTSPWLD
ncbi:hypothetical protein CBR_g24421 [Chara braunii]|uniref:Reverse transcriptase domain-containing protein n=1 Tax=Chara braunii TaxID=69332 RepID=A0A388JMR3_CHABU|nr:hypothetical protein CBR_g24421 [Chara braunii]|eukprot:GBG59078.1 hypothetical protein CBR_g24421 [Chara braunii]